MSIRFDPSNGIIRLCMSGMAMEDEGNLEGARAAFQEAWDEAADDYERFIAAYHLGRQQQRMPDRLKWMETALECARRIDDEDVRSAYATLYLNIARCYEALGDLDNAKRYFDLSDSHAVAPTDEGPFYHGTKADLQTGDLLTAGGYSNYQAELVMNHIYFTANVNGAGLAAALAAGEGRERIYRVEPTGAFENDPNVTDKKFPGNLTRSYRSLEPLRIVGEITEWAHLTAAERREWREKLARNTGEIIN